MLVLYSILLVLIPDMKLLLFFLCVLTLRRVQSRMLGINETVEDKCIRDLGLEETEIQITIRESHTPDDNEHYGKFYVCMWKGRGVMNDDGDIEASGIGKFLSEVVLNPNIPVEAENIIINRIKERCINERGKTEGETGVRLKNCIAQNLKELYHNFLYVDKEI